LYIILLIILNDTPDTAEWSAEDSIWAWRRMW